jgi:hypothetical protein
MNQFLKKLNSPNETIREDAKRRLQEFSYSLHDISMNIDGPIRYDESIRTDSIKKLDEMRRRIGNLKILYEAIEHKYPDDSDVNFSTKSNLFHVLWHLHDEATPEFIVDVYPKLPENHRIRFSALRVLTEINTEKSLRLLAQLLIKRKLDVERDALILFLPLWKHTENVKSMLPEILQILDSKEFRRSILILFKYARKNGHITSRDFAGQDLSSAKQGLIKDLIKENKRRLKLSKTGDSYRDSTDLIGLMIEFLGCFRDDNEITTLIRQFLGDSDSGIILNATLALLSQEKPLEIKNFYRVAADPITRIDLYEGLKYLGQTQLFPDEFYNQESFAEAIMINWLRSGMEMGKPPDKIQLLTSREIECGDTHERVFIYKFWYKNNPDVWMVGQSGPQPIDSSRVSTESYLTFSGFEKLEEKTIDEHVNTIIEYLESING